MADYWFWDDRTNTLESRVANPTKKSHIVKSLCAKYLYLPTDNKRNKKPNRFHNQDNDGQYGIRGDGKDKKSGNIDYAHLAQLNCLFKRAVTAAGKISKLAENIMTEERVREWTLDSVKNLAWQEMMISLKAGKILKFNRQLQSKAYSKDGGRPGQNNQHNNGTASDESPRTAPINPRTHYTSPTPEMSVKSKNYMEMLKKYMELAEFDEFALALVNYFSVIFELRQFEKTNDNENSGKSPKDIKLQQLKSNDLKLKKKSFEHKLGISYASLLLGDNDIKKYHHMSSGERRLYSFTETDQILGEVILEFCAMVVFLVFRADKSVDLNDIRTTLGKEIRTNHFNPYFHEKIAEKLESIKKFTVSRIKNKPPNDDRDASMVYIANPGTSGSSPDRDKSSIALRLPNINTMASDISGLSVNDSNADSKTVLVPSHERAAAERRIKGNRPSIAAVIHQNSGIISAALNGGQEMTNLSQKYRLQDNMFKLNKFRMETTTVRNKKKTPFDILKQRRCSKGYSMNVSPCRRLTIFQRKQIG